MSRRALVLFVALSLMWGIPYLLIKVAVEELEPYSLVMGRTAIGTALLVPLAIRQRSVPAALARWRWVAVYTVVEVALPWVMLARAETVLPSGLTALLVAGVPTVGAVLAMVGGGSAGLGRRGILGLAVGLVGVGLVVGLDLDLSAPGTGVAVLEVLVVVVGYALGPMILARKLHDVPASGVITISLGVVALGTAPLGIAQWPRHVGGDTLAAVAVLGAVCTAAAFLVLFALVAEVGPVRATVITYVNPAVAVVAGALFLDESVSVWTVAGFTLIVIGSALATQRRVADIPEPEAAAQCTDDSATAPAGRRSGLLPDAGCAGTGRVIRLSRQERPRLVHHQRQQEHR